MKFFVFTTLFSAVSAFQPNVRNLYRVDPNAGRDANMETMVHRKTLSFPIDESNLLPSQEMSMGGPAQEMSMDTGIPFPVMSMPNTCDTTYSCPASCDCGGQIVEGGDICDCYSITSLTTPPIMIAPQGTWYCFEVTLDKSVDGCGDAKQVSHAVLAAGFSEPCHFFPGGQDMGGTDDWFFQNCDNSAATGLKFDFGQTCSGSLCSITYCFDVSCEAAPAGQGSVNWVLKSGNDRCDIQVTEGPVPNCGVSDELCHPECSIGGGGGGGGGE